AIDTDSIRHVLSRLLFRALQHNARAHMTRVVAGDRERPLPRALRTQRISRRRQAAIRLSHYKITPACNSRALARLKDLSAVLLVAGPRVGKGRRAFFRRCREAL